MSGPIFVVTAYRWGQRNAHSYVAGAVLDQATAEILAENLVEYRGGKYAAEVVKCEGDLDDSGQATREQVAYVESPYFGKAGDAGHFHPADDSKSSHPSRRPFTVRELQNELWHAQRQIDEATAARKALQPFVDYAIRHGITSLHGHNGALLTHQHWIDAIKLIRPDVQILEDVALETPGSTKR